jgi:CheY-like chemotaxis protein
MDTGTGIPPGIVDRIFEPFFSTKGPVNGETILVVDDKAAVREVTRPVITDLHMPRMNGLDFARLLKGKLPKAGIIVASGRLEDREEKEFKTLGVSALLEKPFTQEKLVTALKTVFESECAAQSQAGIHS